MFGKLSQIWTSGKQRAPVRVCVLVSDEVKGGSAAVHWDPQASSVKSLKQVKSCFLSWTDMQAHSSSLPPPRTPWLHPEWQEQPPSCTCPVPGSALDEWCTGDRAGALQGWWLAPSRESHSSRCCGYWGYVELAVWEQAQQPGAAICRRKTKQSGLMRWIKLLVK